MVKAAQTNGKGNSDGLDIPANLKRTAPNAGQPSYEELLQMVQALQAKVQAQPKPKLKVSDKGALSLYGFGRFPISMYASTWLKVLNMADEIRTYIEENKSSLSWK